MLLGNNVLGLVAGGAGADASLIVVAAACAVTGLVVLSSRDPRRVRLAAREPAPEQGAAV
jgi:hypothetical protein